MFTVPATGAVLPTVTESVAGSLERLPSEA